MNRLKLTCILVGAVLLGMIAAQPAMGAKPTDSSADGSAATAIELTPAEAAAELILFAVVDIGIVMLVLSFVLCLYRIIRGPTLIDRGIATDTITLHVVGIAILLTISLRTLLYFDAVLIFAILGFATTVAFAQFIGRRRAV